MRDGYGREIDYLRISVTDRCNLRCRYCMPHGVPWVPMPEILTFEESAAVAAAAARLGITKIKVTGGEPLVRKGCADFVRMLKQIPGIRQVTLTTNGILLAEQLDGLLAAGLDAVNISLDTLDAQLYAAVTGGGDIRRVLDPIRRLCRGGTPPVPVKINAVSFDPAQTARALSCEYRGPGWTELLELARCYPVDVRFIELMPIGYGKQFPAVSHAELLKELQARFPDLQPDTRPHGNGPAVYYRIPGFAGSVGFISAIHGKFCGSCSRLRLTSQGFLKSCLSYEDGADLRAILRAPCGEAERERRLSEAITGVIRNKPGAHCFESPSEVTEKKNMVQIGG